MAHPGLDSEIPVLRRQLMRQARFALNNLAQAEDLVQDTLLAVVQQHHSNRGDAKLGTWAMAILKNKVADWYRSARQQHTVSLEDDSYKLTETIDALYTETGHYAEPVATWQQPDNLIAQRQMMVSLEGCMARLPAQTRRAFMMREWLGFETAEICVRLRVSPDNCRTLLHRARTALRVCMQAHNPNLHADL